MATSMLSQPIDDESLSARIVASALAAERQLLPSARLPAEPGGYLLFVGPSVQGGTDELGPLAQGTRPIYAGAAADLRGRAQRYRSPQSLRGAENFFFDRLWIAVVPTRTLAGALLCEGVLIEVCSPLFNTVCTGLGSRVQGARRVAAQRPSPFDRRYRRPWAKRASPADACATLLGIVSKVAGPDATGPLWPPLPAT